MVMTGLSWSPFAVAGARATPVTINRDISYGDSPARILDVYWPAGAPPKPRPAVLLVHGGGWAGGDKSGEGLLGAAVARAGMVGFAVNYTLAGPGRPTWPTAFDDVQAAVRWIRAHAADYAVEPGQIGALGDSAGGQLAALLGTAASGPFDTGAGVQAVVVWSAPFDLAALDAAEGAAACPQRGLCLPRSLQDALRTFMGCPPEACSAAYSAASPLNRVSPGDPPLMLVNSTHELVPEEQASAMTVRARGAGIATKAIVLDGTQHGTDYASRVTGTSVAFLRARLNPDRVDPAGSSGGRLGGWGWLAAAAFVVALGAAGLAWRRRRSWTWF